FQAKQTARILHPALADLPLCGKRMQLASIDHADQNRVRANAVATFLLGDAADELLVGRLYSNRQAIALRPPFVSSRPERHEAAAAVRTHMRNQRCGGCEKAVHLDIK